MGIINSDEFATVSSANGGELLKPYDVEINGHKTTVKLTDADARRRGLLEVDEGPSEEVAALQGEVDELKALLAESKEREVAAVNNMEAAQAKAAKAAADAKEAAPAANKQAPAPQNKAADAKAPKADG